MGSRKLQTSRRKGLMGQGGSNLAQEEHGNKKHEDKQNTHGKHGGNKDKNKTKFLNCEVGHYTRECCEPWKVHNSLTMTLYSSFIIF